MGIEYIACPLGGEIIFMGYSFAEDEQKYASEWYQATDLENPIVVVIARDDKDGNIESFHVYIRTYSGDIEIYTDEEELREDYPSPCDALHPEGTEL